MDTHGMVKWIRTTVWLRTAVWKRTAYGYARPMDTHGLWIRTAVRIYGIIVDTHGQMDAHGCRDTHGYK